MTRIHRDTIVPGQWIRRTYVVEGVVIANDDTHGLVISRGIESDVYELADRPLPTEIGTLILAQVDGEAYGPVALQLGCGGVWSPPPWPHLLFTPDQVRPGWVEIDPETLRPIIPGLERMSPATPDGGDAR